MNKQLFFLVEYNLAPLQKILRYFGCSAFMQYDEEIGLKQNSKDAEIISRVVRHKKELGIDRIILTRDTTDFAICMQSFDVKIIVLQDTTKRWDINNMRQTELVRKIIVEANNLLATKGGPAIRYIQCSKMYKK